MNGNTRHRVDTAEICAGHQDLRDIVTRMHVDLSYVKTAIDKLVMRMDGWESNMLSRIEALERENERRIGEARGVSRSAALVAGAVSLLGTLIAIGVSLMVR